MSNPQIRMDQLSENSDPLESLHYAITRERGQENQQHISSTHAKNPNGSGINLIQRTRQQTARRSILTTPPNNNKIPDCWKCGYKFIKGHLDNCPAKNTIGNICRKIGHYAKVCRSDIPPRRSEIQNTERNSQNHNYNRTQQPNNTQQQANTRRVRNIQQSNPKTKKRKKKPKQKPRNYMLYWRNGGRLELHKLHTIAKLHNGFQKRPKQKPAKENSGYKQKAMMSRSTGW